MCVCSGRTLSLWLHIFSGISRRKSRQFRLARLQPPSISPFEISFVRESLKFDRVPPYQLFKSRLFGKIEFCTRSLDSLARIIINSNPCRSARVVLYTKRFGGKLINRSRPREIPISSSANLAYQRSTIRSRRSSSIQRTIRLRSAYSAHAVRVQNPKNRGCRNLSCSVARLMILRAAL